MKNYIEVSGGSALQHTSNPDWTDLHGLYMMIDHHGPALWARVSLDISFIKIVDTEALATFGIFVNGGRTPKAQRILSAASTKELTSVHLERVIKINGPTVIQAKWKSEANRGRIEVRYARHMSAILFEVVDFDGVVRKKK